MITAYVRRQNALVPVPLGDEASLPDEVLWIDLFEPTVAEEKAVESMLSVSVPTREEMQEIEISSRLYQEHGASYMTATVLSRTETETPQSRPVTFILAGHRLVTLRYTDPMPFRAYAAQVQRPGAPCASGEDILAGLLDAIVDRIADILERTQHEMDELSAHIFGEQQRLREVDLEEVLRKIGLAQGLTTRARESLVSIGRLPSFLARPADGKPEHPPTRAFDTVARDVTSLSDHATFLSNKISFMLDATLGMINIKQTGIIKIFSVAAVVFLPPTLIASIYGMNFAHMPELSWPWGYPVAVGLMVVSAIVPYLYFKLRGWL